MFTFSFQQFNQLSSQPIALSELLEILNLQGLEVKKVVPWQNDTAITIEVKANRAFCLSYLGLLREVMAFKKLPAPNVFNTKTLLQFDDASFPIPIQVEAKSACPDFGAVIIENINNRVALPQEMRKALEAVGLNSVNPVVDLLNLVMLETGQPLHAYDRAKIKTGLTVRVNKHHKNITTLNQTELTLPRGPVIITDAKEVLAVAGVIGTQAACVTEDTTSIVVECASFNPTAIRIASRALKISTPSAFRFERGVDATQIKTVLAKCVGVLTQVVGGQVLPQAYYFGKTEKKPIRIILSAKKVNATLGVELTSAEIVSCLRQYYFDSVLTKRGIETVVPSYRLDIKAEIDLIGELARIYGYHRIQPTLPRLPVSCAPNPFREKSLALREVLVGLGFYEVMSYSFIPLAAQAALKIPAGHALASAVELQNPLSQDYAVMRPSLAYSLMQTTAYNYSIGNKNLAIFEIGKVYFRDPTSDTRHREEDLCELLFTGVHIERGFGLVKDIDYHFYDISNFLSLMLGSLGATFTLEATEVPFLRAEASFAILINGQQVGYAGQINPEIWQNIPNGKLILTESHYVSLKFDKIPEIRRIIGARAIYPAVIREYNFWSDRAVPVARILEPIKMADLLIHSVQLKDVYDGKGIEPGKKATLVTVKYVHPDKTLTMEEVVAIEERFLSKLGEQGIKLGQ